MLYHPVSFCFHFGDFLCRLPRQVSAAQAGLLREVLRAQLPEQLGLLACSISLGWDNFQKMEDSSCLSSTKICCVHTPTKHGYGSHLGSSVQVIHIQHCYYTRLLLATTFSVAFEAYAILSPFWWQSHLMLMEVNVSNFMSTPVLWELVSINWHPSQSCFPLNTPSLPKYIGFENSSRVLASGV